MMRDSANEVLRAIATSGPLSRAQLARDLGLSGPTLTQATKYLLELGLISEVKQAPSTGGRPATLLGLIANAGQIIGVKLAQDHLFGICINLESEIQFSFSEKFDARGNDAIVALAENLKKQMKRVRGQVLGIGVGIPGVVSSSDSSTATSSMLDWHHLSVGEELTSILKTPVLLENDVNTLAISESLFGRAKDISNFITVTFGRGIGLGIVINGELYAGTSGAGEFGHVTMDINGELCECGKKGCLETIAADAAILKRAKSLGLVSERASFAKLKEAARLDKKLAENAFKQSAEAVGLALANVVSIFGPELILVSGESSDGWDIWGHWLEASLRRNTMPILSKFDIELDPWDDGRWALGATAIVMSASLTKSNNDVKTIQDVRDRLRVIGGNKVS
jgi:predicted NBD/HSP70 family sugar kinase